MAGERDRVQPGGGGGGFIRVLQRRGGPGVVSASGELPGALPQEERCPRDPRPAGETHLFRAPGSGVTGDRLSRSCPNQGRTALRTAAAEGQKSICPGHSWRPAPSARLAKLPQH